MAKNSKMEVWIFFIFMLTKKYICGITFISVGDIIGFMPHSKQGAEQFGSFQCHAESIHFEKKTCRALMSNRLLIRECVSQLVGLLISYVFVSE